MRKLAWMIALGLEVVACGQVAGLGEEYTVADGGEAPPDGGSSGAASSSGTTTDSGVSSSSSSSGAASSSSSGGATTNYCNLNAFKNTASDCALCVVDQNTCKPICEQTGSGAKAYLDCLRSAGDRTAAGNCTIKLGDAGEQQTQRDCILNDCQDECPLIGSTPGG